MTSRSSFRMYRVVTARAASWMVALMCLSAALAPSPAAAQEMDARGREMTREQLQASLERFEEAASASGYSRQLREQAGREAELIRNRLQEGDFRVGDRIVLSVRGHPALSDTLIIEPGSLVRLADIGEVSLRGVLRSELREHLTQELQRYIRDPVVTTESLIRLGIMGRVNRPSFMVLPASVLLEDAIMAAGGPAADADLDNIRIERGGELVWEGAALRDALVEGRTLDQLSLRAGDRIEVPQKNPGFFSGGVVRTLLVTVPSLLLLASRLGAF